MTVGVNANKHVCRIKTSLFLTLPPPPTWWRGGKSATWTGQITTLWHSPNTELRPCAYLLCHPWIRLVYLLSTPSSSRACGCCIFTLFPSAAPRPPPAPAEPPREPEPGVWEPVRTTFLDEEFIEEQLVLWTPRWGLQSVLSILATGRQREGEGGVGGRRRRGGTEDGPEAATAGTNSAAHKWQTGRCVSAELKGTQRACSGRTAPLIYRTLRA